MNHSEPLIPLESGEQELARGAPDSRLYARRALPFLLIGGPAAAFSLVWLAVMFFWERPYSFPVRFYWIGAAASVVSGVFVLMPLIYRLQARRTFYVLTTKRALVYHRKGRDLWHLRSSTPYPDRAHIEIFSRDDQSGDLIFSRSWTRTWFGMPVLVVAGFFALPVLESWARHFPEARVRRLNS